MMTFAPLTPELRARLAQSVARSLLRWVPDRDSSLETAIEAARAAAPNATAVRRSAHRLGRHPGVVRVAMPSVPGGHALTVLDRCVADVDRARLLPGTAEPSTFASRALVYRCTRLSWRKRVATRRRELGTLYVDRHAVARFVERGPIDPRACDARAQALAAFDRIARDLILANLSVERAFEEGRLETALAATFPVPCPVSDGLWVLEASTSGEETTDAVALTYVGEAQLTSDQWGFLTLCGDGDLVGALRAYPEALPRAAE